MDSERSSSRLSSTSRGFSFSTLAIWKDKDQTMGMTTHKVQKNRDGCPWSSIALNFVQQVSLLDKAKKAERVRWNVPTWWETVQLHLNQLTGEKQEDTEF